MPFTPLHLGPALAALPLRKYLHIPTFILGNVIPDVEGIIVLAFGLNYPLHGYMHTLLTASVFGLVLGLVMFKLEKPTQPFYRMLKLETERSLPLKSFIAAGVSGAFLHVILDAFLYSEMKPLFPLAVNPLIYAPISMSEVYLLCVGLGILGLMYYVGLFALEYFRRKK